MWYSKMTLSTEIQASKSGHNETAKRNGDFAQKEGSIKSVPNYMPKTLGGIFCNKLTDPRRESKKHADNIRLIWSNIHR